MTLTRRIAAAALGGGVIAGALLGAGAASADPISAQTNTKYAYGPYTADQCHSVLMYHPALVAAYNANPGAGSPGACISKGGGATYLYTNVNLG